MLYELSFCEIKEKNKKMKNPEIQITEYLLPVVGGRAMQGEKVKRCKLLLVK